MVLSRGKGGGANENYLLLDSAKFVISRMVYTMAADLKTTGTYFQRKTQKYVREWLEGNKSLYLNVFKFETNVRMMHT